MWCLRCNNDLVRCVCPDIDERLQSLSKSPYLSMSMCEGCGRHLTRCACNPQPEKPAN